MSDISIPLIALAAAVAMLTTAPQQVNIDQLSGAEIDASGTVVQPIDGASDTLQQSPAVVDQLGDRDSAPGGVDQLSDTLEPIADSGETALVRQDHPKGDLASEVVAAWNMIRQRGQTPTPDLIANEIGADKVAEFLAGGGQAARILATGQIPDSNNPISPDDPKGRVPPPPPPPPYG